MIDHPPTPDAPARVLCSKLVEAQERILYHAARVWNASNVLQGGNVLDVGCGLGGGAIFWAQEFGAYVTAVTCVPSHVDLVARFATCAGVGSRVFPILCDALEVPGDNHFDAAIAVDSSCYLPRQKWFRRLSTLLRPGGRVLIMDCFLGDPQYEVQFNQYWRTRIGTFDEYLAAAASAGLETLTVQDISHHIEHFWTTTVALIQAEVKEVPLDATKTRRYDESVRAHLLVRQGLIKKGLRYAVMDFSKRS
jgi:cyclopropane fatty-acyl-phospholipid synthase-like methyltransferase